MNDKTYNGWTNWETWNVNLWIENERPLYYEKVRFLREASEVNAISVWVFCKAVFPNGTPDMKTPTELDDVNWDEIAKHWRIEASELD